MLIKFLGDCHFGKRPSHSTKASAHRHKSKVDAAAQRALGTPHDMLIQLGDLFESYAATNNDMVRAADATRTCDYILKGNHDHSHNSYNVSALEDLEELCDAPVIKEPCIQKVAEVDDSISLHFIPYMPTQTEFLEALDNLAPVRDEVNILILHTNIYGEGFNTSEVENNLTKERALELSGRFDLVVSGHEHNGSCKHGVHMVGSLYPHNFGDISSKSVLIFDTETKEITKELIWNASLGYTSVTPEQFLKLDNNHGFDFIEISGDVPSTEILPLVKHVGALLNDSAVSGIKNNVKVLRNIDVSGDATPSVNWKEFVKEQLTDEQYELFLELDDV